MRQPASLGRGRRSSRKCGTFSPADIRCSSPRGGGDSGGTVELNNESVVRPIILCPGLKEHDGCPTFQGLFRGAGTNPSSSTTTDSTLAPAELGTSNSGGYTWSSVASRSPSSTRDVMGRSRASVPPSVKMSPAAASCDQALRTVVGASDNVAATDRMGGSLLPDSKEPSRTDRLTASARPRTCGNRSTKPCEPFTPAPACSPAAEPDRGRERSWCGVWVALALMRCSI